MQTGAGVGAESAKRARISVRAAAERESNRVAKSKVFEAMKDMDVIEVTKVPSEYSVLSSLVLDVLNLTFDKFLAVFLQYF